MKLNKFTLALAVILAVGLVSCGTKKKVAEATAEPEVIEEPAVPAWHTCVMQGAKATIILGDQKISANTTLQVVRDSMLIISIMPMFGIEMMRLEATPEEIMTLENKIISSVRERFGVELNPEVEHVPDTK